MADGRRHDHPKQLLEFLRKSLTSQYVHQAADWLKREYPGSCDELLPEIRKIYKELRSSEGKL